MWLQAGQGVREIGWVWRGLILICGGARGARTLGVSGALQRWYAGRALRPCAAVGLGEWVPADYGRRLCAALGAGYRVVLWGT